MDSISIKGYKSFKDITLPLNRINMLIGSNGSGKSNLLSLFELLGASYDGQLARFVAQYGGIDKLFHKGRKTTDRISVTVLDGKNSYILNLMDSDGRLIVESEKLGYTSYSDHWTFNIISQFSSETALRDYHGALRGEYIKKIYISDKEISFPRHRSQIPFYR